MVVMEVAESPRSETVHLLPLLPHVLGNVAKTSACNPTATGAEADAVISIFFTRSCSSSGTKAWRSERSGANELSQSATSMAHSEFSHVSIKYLTLEQKKKKMKLATKTTPLHSSVPNLCVSIVLVQSGHRYNHDRERRGKGKQKGTETKRSGLFSPYRSRGKDWAEPCPPQCSAPPVHPIKTRRPGLVT